MTEMTTMCKFEVQYTQYKCVRGQHTNQYKTGLCVNLQAAKSLAARLLARTDTTDVRVTMRAKRRD